MSNLDSLEEMFGKIRGYLDGMDKIRESLLPLQRTTVRICSEIIKNVHRNELSLIPPKIQMAQENLHQMQELIKGAPGDFSKDYIQIVKQELGEAVILYNLVALNQFPTIEECGIDLVDYAYALSDVVGELRRYILNCIRKEEIEKASQAMNQMEEIYSQLFTLDYPSGLIPGLRNKVDAARNILARTEGDIAISLNILKLNKSLNLQK